MQPPTGDLTFLFTDIEGSSQLWEKHPQAMAQALRQHDTLMRSIFEEHRGYVFKTMGDAFCVSFGSPLDAAAAALAAQLRLASETWGETGTLRVRMALHSGEADERDGDYFGRTLNRVARLLAAGHGGQTLFSRMTAERTAEHLPAGVSLRDLGERRLKDLNRPERIFQLVAPGLRADFPALRSLEVLPNNLPAQVTSFIGRADEMAEVKRLLGTTRLLTLTGPGGTGKTRLSLQVAADVLENYPHGVWLVELATVSDASMIGETIASAIDIREEAGRPPLDTLINAIRGWRLLLVLDNCEHLIGAVADIAGNLLRRCPDLRILASSREPLSIAGESIWPVPPLDVPEFVRGGETPPLSTFEDLEAVQLFVERAAAVRPGFALTPENALTVARLCWRLDGIALAIELAAARVKLLTPAQILARLDDRFRLLSSGS
ncbi:MAG: adenylate/guanylate cyclase domain-containing protein, partial [Chthoniobacteraceae bacterium]